MTRRNLTKTSARLATRASHSTRGAVERVPSCSCAWRVASFCALPPRARMVDARALGSGGPRP
eukprot:3103670-Pyramimonas_sp.AAC.1